MINEVLFSGASTPYENSQGESRPGIHSSYKLYVGDLTGDTPPSIDSGDIVRIINEVLYSGAETPYKNSAGESRPGITDTIRNKPKPWAPTEITQSTSNLAVTFARPLQNVTLADFSLKNGGGVVDGAITCLLYTSPSPRDGLLSRMPSSA